MFIKKKIIIIVSVKLILGKLITLETWVQGIHNDIVRALETRCRDFIFKYEPKTCSGISYMSDVQD